MLEETLLTTVKLRFDKARECLKDADMNIQNDAYATAANRSYYCIFHTMRAILVTIGFTAKTHAGNISEFRRVFIKTGLFATQFSDIIGRAFEVRNDSDYDDFYVISKEEVLQQAENAREFLEAAEEYIKVQLSSDSTE